MNTDINDIEFIHNNLNLTENYDSRSKSHSLFQENNYNYENEKLWFRKLSKAVKVIEQDLNEKSLKMNTIRSNLNLLTSMSSKLIFKEVEENLILLKKNLNHLYSFMDEMNKLDIKYEAIIYDCNRDNIGNRVMVPNSKQSLIKKNPKTNSEKSYSSYQQNVNSFPSSSFHSSSFCNTLKSVTSFLECGSQINQTIIKSKSLTTPDKYFKDLHGYASPILPKSNKLSPSPKATPRKNTIPRRRNLTNETYFSTSDISDSVSLFNDTLGEGLHIKGDAIVEELINYPVLHEKLAQSINRVFNGENVPISEDKNELSDHRHHHFQEHEDEHHSKHLNHFDNNQSIDNCSSIKSYETNENLDHTLTEEGNNIEANEIQLPDTAIQDILSGLENDPVFNDFLNICSNKKDIYTTNVSSPFTSSSLTTPKSDDTHFKSPFSTPIRSFPSINCVVKDLMKDLKTPEKSQPVSSPLSTAIESSINDNAYNLSEASQVIPVLDFNALINSPSKKTQTVTNVQPSCLPYSVSIPISLQSQESTLVFNNTTNNNLIVTGNKKANSALNKTSISNALKKMPLKHKKINLARIESSNSQGLKRKFSEKSETSSHFRTIVPKSQESTATSFSTITVSKSSYQSSASGTNLRAKFNEASNLIETTSSKKVDNKQTSQNNDLVLLKSMNVDKFLSLIYEKSSKS